MRHYWLNFIVGFLHRYVGACAGHGVLGFFFFGFICVGCYEALLADLHCRFFAQVCWSMCCSQQA